MKDRVPCRLAFGAKLVVALMAVAAVPAWTLGQGKPGSGDPEIVIQVADGADGADVGDTDQAKVIEAQIKALMQKLEALKASKAAEAQKKAVEKIKEGQEKLGEKMKALRIELGDKDGTAHKVVGREVKVLVSGQDGIKVIGADGKEIKDARVIIGGSAQGGTHVVRPLTTGGLAGVDKKVEVHVVGQDGKAVTAPNVRWTTTQPAGEHANYYWVTGNAAGGGNAITLSRATYKVSKDQATALGTLLGSIKATVMETKVDGDSITVTTTPEAQQSIGQIVRLIQGQSGNMKFEWKLAPGPGQNLFVPKPAAPPTPARPAKPVKSGTSESGLERVNVNVILDQLKKAGDEVKVNEADMAKLQEMLKTLKPLELRLKTEKKPDGDKKPDGEKK